MRSAILFLLLFPIVLSAKTPRGFTRHPDGLYYRIIRQSSDTLHPAYGDYIFMHLIKHHPEKEEVFNTHIFNTPAGVEFLLERPAKVPDVTQVFTLMSAGDSAVVKIPAFYTDSGATPKKHYTYYLKLLSFQSSETYHRDKRLAELKQTAVDSVLIRNVQQIRSFTNVVFDSSGIAYRKETESTGELLQAGDTVRLHYKGSLMNGFEFDNSYNRNDPLVFVLGARQVIDGLDNALHFFRRGERGTVMIPSRLGYGNREVGQIPPNSVLIFDIELLPE